MTELLLPHLTRIEAVQHRLQFQTMAFSVLDALPMGVLLLGPRGQALYSNPAAEEIFRCADGLALRNGVLAASDSKANAALRRAIQIAASPRGTLD